MSEETLNFKLDEFKDVLPIFRANPSLLEDGLKLIKGEKYLTNESLQHIDLLFKDRNGTMTFAEVEWSYVDENQIKNYATLIQKNYPGSRLIWAIPSNLINKAHIPSGYEIEIKSFERKIIVEIFKFKSKAINYIDKILSILSQSFEVGMGGEKIKFENPIVACYFYGEAITDKGKKKLGMKQQGIGRQLDLIKCLISGHIAKLHPEKVLLLLSDILKAPYCYKPGKFWDIVNGGFIEAVEKDIGSPLTSLKDVVIDIWRLVKEFNEKYSEQLKILYGRDLRKYDILTLLLLDKVNEAKKTTFTVDELVKHLVNELEFKPSLPPPRIKHSILNQWIENRSSVENYENDMAKRVLEIATLRRILIPKSGIVVMRILCPSKRGEKFYAERVPCQMLSFNSDNSLYLEINQYT